MTGRYPCGRTTRSAKAWVIILAGALAGMGGISAARADETQAKSLLKAMSDYLAAQKAMSFDYDVKSDPYKELMPEVNDAKDLGSGVIHGVECDHLAFRTKEVDWQIWIAQGARPYPCRYVITSKKVTGQPQYTLDTWGWKTGAEVTADGFKLEIPANAKKLTPAEVPELNDIPAHFTAKRGK